MSEVLPMGGVAAWVKGVIEALGYAGVAILIALENLFPPIPSELILPLAGFLAGEGRFSLPGTIAAATAGSVAGALVLYGLGGWIGEERIRALVRRWGKVLLLREADLDRASAWFERWDEVAVLVCRLVPVVRSLVSIPAGLNRMPLGRFLLFTTIGSALWNGLLIGLGFALDSRWEEVEPVADLVQYAVLAAAILLIARFLWGRRQSLRRRAA